MSCMEEATSPWFLPVPCGDRSPEGWPLQERSESRDFSSPGCCGGPAEVYYLLNAGEMATGLSGAIKHHLASQDFSRTKWPTSNQALQNFRDKSAKHRTFLSLFGPRTVLFRLQVHLNIHFLVLKLCRSYNTISGFFPLCL